MYKLQSALFEIVYKIIFWSDNTHHLFLKYGIWFSSDMVVTVSFLSLSFVISVRLPEGC